MANILANVKHIFAANSPDSGEYMANGLTNAIRHQSQWSQNDRHIFVGVRKHSRSFVWRCEYYATLTLWRISCECKTFIFAAYSPEMIRLPRRITKNWGLSNGYECFRISYESLRISYEAYDQSAEFRVNPLRMLRLLTNVLRSLQMPCHQYEYIAMITKTLRICFPSEF